MDLAKLESLKELMIHGQDFSKVFEYFFDHFGDHDEFQKIGEQTSNAYLEGMFGQAGKAWFNLTAMRLEQRLTLVPEYQFIHGTCLINGKYMLTVIFFADQEVGVLAYCSPAALLTGQVQYMRCSARPLRQTRGPSPN